MWMFFVLGFARASELDRRFSKVPGRVGDHAVEVYLADTNERRARGLMFVEALPRDQGMLFAFDRAQNLSFWMKNTHIPLSIGFLDDACVLREIVEMKVASSVLSPPPTYASARPMRFALEMNSGWFARNAIEIGARLRLTDAAAAGDALKACVTK